MNFGTIEFSKNDSDWPFPKTDALQKSQDEQVSLARTVRFNSKYNATPCVIAWLNGANVSRFNCPAVQVRVVSVSTDEFVLTVVGRCVSLFAVSWIAFPPSSGIAVGELRIDTANTNNEDEIALLDGTGPRSVRRRISFGQPLASNPDSVFISLSGFCFRTRDSETSTAGKLRSHTTALSLGCTADKDGIEIELSTQEDSQILFASVIYICSDSIGLTSHLVEFNPETCKPFPLSKSKAGNGVRKAITKLGVGEMAQLLPGIRSVVVTYGEFHFLVRILDGDNIIAKTRGSTLISSCAVGVLQIGPLSLTPPREPDEWPLRLNE